MFERKDQVKKFLRYMNSRQPNIQFTCKKETNNNRNSFLDVSTKTLNNKLVKSLHWKKTFSIAYMSSSSFLSLKCKKGLIYTLLFQAFNICVDYNTFHKEVQYLKLIRQKNSFLHFFIDSCIKRFLDKLFITHKMSDSVTDKKEIFICLEFLRKISF